MCWCKPWPRLCFCPLKELKRGVHLIHSGPVTSSFRSCLIEPHMAFTLSKVLCSLKKYSYLICFAVSELCTLNFFCAGIFQFPLLPMHHYSTSLSFTQHGHNWNLIFGLADTTASCMAVCVLLSDTVCELKHAGWIYCKEVTMSLLEIVLFRSLLRLESFFTWALTHSFVTRPDPRSDIYFHFVYCLLFRFLCELLVYWARPEKFCLAKVQTKIGLTIRQHRLCLHSFPFTL